MVDLFIDRACELGAEPRIRALNPLTVDIVDSASQKQLRGGGILLMGTRTRDDSSPLSTIREIRRELPHVVVVLCASWRESSRIPIARWTKAGVDDFVTFGGAMDVAEVLRIVEAHSMAPAPAEELKLLQEVRPTSWELDAVLHGLRNACCDLDAAEFARHFGYSPRAFRDFLSDAGFPGPRDVCRVGRLLHMAELIDRGIETPSELARRLGFSDPTEMRQAKWRLKESVARGRDDALVGLVASCPRLLRLLRL